MVLGKCDNYLRFRAEILGVLSLPLGESSEQTQTVSKFEIIWPGAL